MNVFPIAVCRSQSHSFQEVDVVFDNDVFAPTRCLEFFAAFGTLPERFELARIESGRGWRVRMKMLKNTESERVLAKVSVLIGVMEVNIISTI